MSNADFYQSHLDRVSRSFAFCIRQLPSPLRDWVGLSYLLCRIVDTIEDAPWVEAEQQKAAFKAFDAALIDANRVNALDELVSGFPELPDREVALLSVNQRLLKDYHQLPSPVHEILRDLVHSMSLGMQHFSAHRPMRLHTLGEVNQYCFFVAGVVGELLAKLVARVEPRFQMTQAALIRAHHFGLFLQKVNLLKDQFDDEKVGRHLVPSRDEVEASAHENATSALDFLLAVPVEQIEFRRFCAWSLFLGLESLSVARRSLVEKTVLKVSRTRTQELLGEVEVRLQDDSALRRLFAVFCERLGWRAPVRVHNAVEVPDWLVKVYCGLLDVNSLKSLGISST